MKLESSDEKIFIQTNDSVFFNSKSVFVEYIDVIKSPYFLFIYAMNSSEDKRVLKDPFDMEKITSLESVEAVTEWYYTRKNQNPLIDLVPDERLSTLDFDAVDRFMDLQMRENEVLVHHSSPLNFVNVINNLMVDSLLVPKVYIWYPYDNPVIAADVKSLFESDDVVFRHGPLEKCLADVPNDSTFVFSDMTNILVLEDLQKLDYSSIITPIDFAYNRIDDELPLIDIEKMQESHVFKYNQFFATIE